MSFELAVPSEDDFADFMQPLWRGFGNPDPPATEMAGDRELWEPERSIGARADGEWVGGAGAFTLDLTLPGGSTTPVAGVTMVGVSTTHRRRGVLSALMRRQLDDVAERGEVAAILTASETGIYGRFGYGWSASLSEIEIEVAGARFRQDPGSAGRIRLLPLAGAFVAVKAAYERSRRLRAGAISRSDAYWRILLRDDEHQRHGASGLYLVVHEDEDGRPDGYAAYRIKHSWPDGIPDNTTVVVDLFGADFEVEAELWRYLLTVDLSRWLLAEKRPIDDPIRWRLVDPRQLRTRKLVDHLWTRVLDVPGALALRSYGVADTLRIEVVDPQRPASGGRFRVEGGPDGASCSRTTESPHLVMGPEELGCLYLGGVVPSALASAGRISEEIDGALARADRFFPTALAPFNGTMF